jgi:hypothetical protein
MRDESQRGAVIDALDHYFDQYPELADFSGERGSLPALRATLGAAIPALRDSLSLKIEEVDARVIWLIGRMVSIARQIRDAETQKALEPAVEILIQNLDHHESPEIRNEILGILQRVTLQRGAIVASIIRYLGRFDEPHEYRERAFTALAAQTRAASADPGQREALAAAIPFLIDALDSSDTAVRLGAVQALGALGIAARPAEDALRRLASNDSLQTIRDRAQEALKAIDAR